MTQLNSELHIVLGAGQVGPVPRTEARRRGLRVRIVSRSTAPEVSGVEWAQGDVTDRDFLSETPLRGASVGLSVRDPMRYDRWQELLPPLARAVQSAVASAGARLVGSTTCTCTARPRRV